METNLPMVEIRTNVLSYKVIIQIGLLPWLVSGLLSYGLYGTYSTVDSVQCNVCTALSLFVIELPSSSTCFLIPNMSKGEYL